MVAQIDFVLAKFSSSIYIYTNLTILNWGNFDPKSG